MVCDGPGEGLLAGSWMFMPVWKEPGLFKLFSSNGHLKTYIQYDLGLWFIAQPTEKKIAPSSSYYYTVILLLVISTLLL